MIAQWTFIGAGNMAASLIGGLVGSGASTETIHVVDIDPQACERLRRRFAVNTTTTLDTLLPDTGVLIAVKPNVVELVCQQLARLDQQPGLVVSVAAGVREMAMGKWLAPSTPIVRCMPNTPALLGLGASGLYANSNCSAAHKEQAEALMATSGSTVWVENEALLDAVTAVSGSGPAYFFYLIEHMTAAGEKLGLPVETAQQLAIDTAFGAASMARQQVHSPAQLRANVTSAGGTTAAALKVFDAQGTPRIIEQAMQAAHDRAIELGDESTLQ